ESPALRLVDDTADTMQVDAIPVDLEVTAASALAALEKKLSRGLAAQPKPTRSDRIGRAASSLKSVAGALGKDDAPVSVPEKPIAKKKKTAVAKKATTRKTSTAPAPPKKAAAKTADKTAPVES